MSGGTTIGGRATTAAGHGGDTGLSLLRNRIGEVRRARAATRMAAAAATAGLSLVCVAVACFAIDWLFLPSRLTRAAVLAAAAATLVWVWWRHVRPWLSVRESDLDLALLVERQQGVDSDLVAALQFERPDAAAWGSGDLRSAVIDYVAEFSRGWTVPRQVRGAALGRRLAWLAAAVAVVGAAVVWRPDFAAAFLNRMTLGTAHYPTRTRIESLEIGGVAIDPATLRPGSVKAATGAPLDVRVVVGGDVPAAAAIRLVPAAGGTATEMELAAGAGESVAEFTSRLPRLLESIDVQVFAGDAWTDPVRVQAVALPIIETTLAAAPPDYARGASEADAEPRRSRQISALEGSRVALAVSCGNKRLDSATLVIDAVEYPLARAADGAWRPAAPAAPLERVDQPLQFEVRVIDEDGLGADAPVTGAIRLRRDAPPRVVADLPTRLVLPAGQPRLDWSVNDDHGIRSAVVLLEPLAAGNPVPAEPREFAVFDAARSADRGLPLTGTLPLPLAELGLRKGDQVRVTLQATDERGTVAGRTVASDPIVLEVTDEPGLLAALVESDARAAQQLDAILERQLEVGGSPAAGLLPPGTPASHQENDR